MVTGQIRVKDPFRRLPHLCLEFLPGGHSQLLCGVKGLVVFFVNLICHVDYVLLVSELLFIWKLMELPVRQLLFGHHLILI